MSEDVFKALGVAVPGSEEAEEEKLENPTKKKRQGFLKDLSHPNHH